MTAFRLIREDEAKPAPPTPDDLADAAMLAATQGAQRLRRRGLLRAFAADEMGAHPDTVGIERLATGQVRITAPETRYASLAQRGPWIAIAISTAPVGVDVEVYPGEDPLPLNLLHAEEQRAIDAAADPQRLFLRFWTGREAWLKARGRGLDLELADLRARQCRGGVLVGEGAYGAVARLIERHEAIAAIVELPPDA